MFNIIWLFDWYHQKLIFTIYIFMHSFPQNSDYSYLKSISIKQSSGIFFQLT